MIVLFAGVCEHRGGCQCWWSKSFDVHWNIHTGTRHLAAHSRRYTAGNARLSLLATVHKLLRLRVVCLTLTDPAHGASVPTPATTSFCPQVKSSKVCHTLSVPFSGNSAQATQIESRLSHIDRSSPWCISAYSSVAATT